VKTPPIELSKLTAKSASSPGTNVPSTMDRPDRSNDPAASELRARLMKMIVNNEQARKQQTRHRTS
jgi:hypothetical protein